MMRECKRTINHSTAAEGLLMAHSKQSKNTSMDAFLVPMDTEPEATQRRKRKQRLDEEEPAGERTQETATGGACGRPTEEDEQLPRP